MLATGVEAPDFSLPDSNGNTVALKDFRGKWVVFWWYPEANSSGCSVQAASLERSLDDLTNDGVVLIGASFNTVAQNDEFACDKSLRLVLLSDPDKVVGEKYKVIRDPSDRHPTKPHRYTYVIDPQGTVVHAEDANQVPLQDYGPHVVELVRKLRAASEK